MLFFLIISVAHASDIAPKSSVKKVYWRSGNFKGSLWSFVVNKEKVMLSLSITRLKVFNKA